MARIRTIKPDAWQDGRLARVSRDARLLWTVLITMADDEGRFRASRAIVYGHGYPEDTDALELIPGWLDELSAAGLLALYEAGGEAFGCFLSWARHQRISKPTPSKFPGPPQVSQGIPGDSAKSCDPNGDGGSSPIPEFPRESQGSRTCEEVEVEVEVEVDPPYPPAGGEGGGSASLSASKPGPGSLPDGLTAEQRQLAEEVFAALSRSHAESCPRAAPPTLRQTGKAVAAHPAVDHLAVAAELDHWAVRPSRPIRDFAATFRTFVKRRAEDDAKREPVEARAEDAWARRERRWQERCTADGVCWNCAEDRPAAESTYCSACLKAAA